MFVQAKTCGFRLTAEKLLKQAFWKGWKLSRTVSQAR